jgi:hypothetical protein
VPAFWAPEVEEVFVMVKFRTKVLAVVSVVAAAGATAVTGLTAASASPATRPSVSGIEHFQLMTTSATSNKESFIALGSVFTAGGVDHQGNKVDTVVVPGGTFKIRHSRGKGTQHFNPKTCLNVISLHGTYKLLPGTGKYRTLSGHGRYQLSIVFVAARNSAGKCSQRKPPVTYQQVIRASGPAKL